MPPVFDEFMLWSCMSPYNMIAIGCQKDSIGYINFKNDLIAWPTTFTYLAQLKKCLCLLNTLFCTQQRDGRLLAGSAPTFWLRRLHFFKGWGGNMTPVHCRYTRNFYHRMASHLSHKFVHEHWDSSSYLLVSHLTQRVCARDSSSCLLVTSAQLMRPCIGRNAFCAVGDFVYHLGLPFFGEM